MIGVTAPTDREPLQKHLDLAPGSRAQGFTSSGSDGKAVTFSNGDRSQSTSSSGAIPSRCTERADRAALHIHIQRSPETDCDIADVTV